MCVCACVCVCVIFLHVFFFLKFIYLWLCWVFVSVRGLSPVAASGGHSIAVHGPLTIAAPLVAEHRLQTRRLSSCGSRAQLLHGMWDPPRPGLEPVSPALAGRFSTTAPPGKPYMYSYKIIMVGSLCMSHLVFLVILIQPFKLILQKNMFT